MAATSSAWSFSGRSSHHVSRQACAHLHHETIANPRTPCRRHSSRQSGSPIEKSSQLPEIIMDQASAEIFPESWRTPKVNAKAALLEASQLERCRDVVNRALSEYPADMLKTTLKKIYCLGRLEYSGAVTGGTRSSSAIYVVCTPTYLPCPMSNASSTPSIQACCLALRASTSMPKLGERRSTRLQVSWQRCACREKWSGITPLESNFSGAGLRPPVCQGKHRRRLQLACRCSLHGR